MKIIEVRAYLLAIPLHEGKFPTPWTWGKFNQILVEVKTDEGITGYGETFAYGAPHPTVGMINQVLRPLLIGADPTDISSLLDHLYRRTHVFGRYGITIFAISGVDIALWDIAGKCAGLPLYRLLGGGGGAKKVAAYASLVRYKDLEHLALAAAHAKEAGYDMIKIHQADVESLQIVRRVVGDRVRLMVDVNCLWSPEEALEMARRFAPFNLYWLEEPIWPPEDFKSLARLRQRTGTPLALGENACTVYQFQHMLESGAADYVQPSVIKVGGVSEWRKVAALAEAYNAIVAPHSFYLGPGLLATAHLVAATPAALSVEYLYAAPEASIFREPPRFEKGFFLLPEGPGLGLEVDAEMLKRYCIA